MTQPLDLVTVLVPARNEEASLVACLESVLTQDYRELQVVVVDGQSTDRTVELVHEVMRRDARVELVTDAHRSIPTALNTGLAAARGRWLVRVDGHSTIPPGYVRRAVARLSEGRWGAVGGRKDGIGRTPAGRAIAAVMASRLGVGNSTYHHGTSETTVDHVPFGVYPVALLREIGGWDERLTANEDYELDYRLRQAGHQLLFDPELAIGWESRQSVRELLRQYHRYGKGKADVAVLHPQSLSPRHLIPPVFVAYLATAGAVSLRRPGVAAAMVAPYAAVVAAGSATTARRLAAGERHHVAPAYLAMHLGWGAGFLTRLPAAVVALRRQVPAAGRRERGEAREDEVA